MAINEPTSKEGIDTEARTRVPVAGGTLVYEVRALGKELVGFEDVTDHADLADALAARDLDRNYIYRLPQLDQ